MIPKKLSTLEHDNLMRLLLALDAYVDNLAEDYHGEELEDLPPSMNFLLSEVSAALAEAQDYQPRAD